MVVKTDGVGVADGRLLLTVKQTAQTLAISPRSVWRLIAGGHLKCVRIGRSVRVRSESVAALTEKGAA